MLLRLYAEATILIFTFVRCFLDCTLGLDYGCRVEIRAVKLSVLGYISIVFAVRPARTN